MAQISKRQLGRKLELKVYDSFWRVIANDTDDNSTSDSFFTFIINAQSLIYNILLNGSEIDRKYEIDTNSNITATAIPAGTNFLV